jgi:hypothetical protein
MVALTAMTAPWWRGQIGEMMCTFKIDRTFWYNAVIVFLIGYGVVAGFNVGDEKPPHD